MTIILRPATEADVKAFRDLRLEALTVCPAAFGADYETDFNRTEEEWRNRIRGNPSVPSVIYLAFQGERLVGMTGAYCGASLKMRHNVHLWGVYVRAEARGQGIATRLLDACCIWAKEQGALQVKLAVVTTNTAAIRTYSGSGFTIYGIEPASLCYEGVCYDDFLMVKRL